jgi:hypothetical protein
MGSWIVATGPYTKPWGTPVESWIVATGPKTQAQRRHEPRGTPEASWIVATCPKTEPWGTPEKSWIVVDNMEPYTTTDYIK